MFSRLFTRSSTVRSFVRPTKVVAAGLIGSSLFYGGVSAGEKVNYDEVRKSIAAILEQEGYDDGSYGPVFVRLAWHAAGTYSKYDNTGGSNGATMRFSPEADHGANAGLAIARKVLDDKVKAKFPGISYADLWTLAGAVAIEEMGGPKISWRAGRTDAADGKSCPPDGRLPAGDKGPAHIRDIFYKMGFNDQEIVALLGAHALGRCHVDRSGFEGPWTRAPTTFSNEYYRLLLEEKWARREWNGPPQYENLPSKDLMMLIPDYALVQDPEFKKWVQVYAKDEERFFKDFSAAFTKLEELGVRFPASQSYTSMFAFGALAALAAAGSK